MPPKQSGKNPSGPVCGLRVFPEMRHFRRLGNPLSPTAEDRPTAAAASLVVSGITARRRSPNRHGVSVLTARCQRTYGTVSAYLRHGVSVLTARCQWILGIYIRRMFVVECWPSEVKMYYIQERYHCEAFTIFGKKYISSVRQASKLPINSIDPRKAIREDFEILIVKLLT